MLSLSLIGHFSYFLSSLSSSSSSSSSKHSYVFSFPYRSRFFSIPSDKTEAISIVLELLAEIDLPSLCQSINSKSTQYTRVDDIIASAATAYGVTPPSADAPESSEKDGKLLLWS